MFEAFNSSSSRGILEGATEMAEGALGHGGLAQSTAGARLATLNEQLLLGLSDALEQAQDQDQDQDQDQERNQSRWQLPPQYSGDQSPRPPHYEDAPHALSRKHVGHYLLFLATVNKLRNTISGLSGHAVSLAKHLSIEERWGLFVQMAVHRFGVWQKAVIECHSAVCGLASRDADCQHAFLPPLDVLMVWAAYLQCPTKYASVNFVHVDELALFLTKWLCASQCRLSSGMQPMPMITLRPILRVSTTTFLLQQLCGLSFQLC